VVVLIRSKNWSKNSDSAGVLVQVFWITTHQIRSAATRIFTAETPRRREMLLTTDSTEIVSSVPVAFEFGFQSIGVSAMDRPPINCPRCQKVLYPISTLRPRPKDSVLAKVGYLVSGLVSAAVFWGGFVYFRLWLQWEAPGKSAVPQD
jgi:hypothetical protein